MNERRAGQESLVNVRRRGRLVWEDRTLVTNWRKPSLNSTSNLQLDELRQQKATPGAVSSEQETGSTNSNKKKFLVWWVWIYWSPTIFTTRSAPRWLRRLTLWTHNWHICSWSTMLSCLKWKPQNKKMIPLKTNVTQIISGCSVGLCFTQKPTNTVYGLFPVGSQTIWYMSPDPFLPLLTPARLIPSSPPHWFKTIWPPTCLQTSLLHL